MTPRLPRTMEVLERGLDDGRHRGVQLYVSRGGEVIADVGFGEARPGAAMTADSIVPWMSSGKPLTAAAAMRLFDRGLFELDDPVADHLPGFTGGGKDAVTIRHLLTHTAGLHEVEHDWPRDDWGTVIDRIRAGSIVEGWTPGERAAYDPANGWFVLGELVARWNGTSFPKALRELVLEPCGVVDTFCGAGKATLALRRDRLGVLYDRTPDGLVARTEMIEPPHVTAASPGGNLRGPIRELGRIHERLPSLLGPETFATMTARQRKGVVDETFSHVLDFGLGVIVDSNRHGLDTVPYGFGPACSERTYGHGGVQSSIAFRDPDRDLVVAWLTNGQIGEPRHQRRNRAINEALWADVDAL